MVQNIKKSLFVIEKKSFLLTGILRSSRKLLFLPVLFLILSSGLFAQTEFPSGDFWSLDAGLGVSGLKADGLSFQAVLDPKLWLSPLLMVGSKLGVNYSFEDNNASDYSDILGLEGQVYLRWNFLRLGENINRQVNIFGQAGVGMIALYRGDANPLDDSLVTRGSVMADAALGVTIPLTERWHIEPLVRGGYPHLWGFSLTAGYKFRLPQKTEYQRVEVTKVEYRDIIQTLPPNEIIKRIMISSVEYILFGPDIGNYNLGISQDAQSLNELVLNEVVKTLKENPAYRVRIEGHANPVTTDPREADELMSLSAIRANTIAGQLRAKGISNEQMVVISYGGTRTVTSIREISERNRRVELIILQVDASTN